ncbi:MAG: hypothetical protein ABH827_05685 [bacterium]
MKKLACLFFLSLSFGSPVFCMKKTGKVKEREASNVIRQQLSKKWYSELERRLKKSQELFAKDKISKELHYFIFGVGFCSGCKLAIVSMFVDMEVCLKTNEIISKDALREAVKTRLASAIFSLLHAKIGIPLDVFKGTYAKFCVNFFREKAQAVVFFDFSEALRFVIYFISCYLEKIDGAFRALDEKEQNNLKEWAEVLDALQLLIASKGVCL